MDKKYNMKSPGVKRLMREAMELRDPTPMYHAQPLEDNLFEWHFTILAPKGTDFDGGCYHGRVLLPSEYPMKPPSIIMLTPNGRFEIHHKICLSNSAYHPESWQPSWSIRTVLLALIGFMPTEGGGAIGSLDMPPSERRRLARCSLEWVCPVCGVPNKDILPPMKEAGGSQDKTMAEVADIVNAMVFKSETEVKAQKKKMSDNPRTPTTTSHQESSSSDHVDTGPVTDGPRQRLHPTQPTPEGSNPPITASPALGGNVSMVPPAVKRATIRTNPADIPRQSRGTKSLALIWILLITISVLVARRIYITTY